MTEYYNDAYFSSYLWVVPLLEKQIIDHSNFEHTRYLKLVIRQH